MLGIVIAVIRNLIAVAVTASAASIPLHTSLQTKHLVEQWHKDSHELDSASSNRCSTSDRY